MCCLLPCLSCVLIVALFGWCADWQDLEERLARAQAFAAEQVQRAERAVLHAQAEARTAALAAAGSASAALEPASSRKHLQRILDLEKDLLGLREENEAKVAELRAQVDKLKSERKEIEARMGGLDIRNMSNEDIVFKQVRDGTLRYPNTV